MNFRNIKLKAISIMTGILSLFGNKAKAQTELKMPTVDYTLLFKDESITTISLGEVNFPTGKIIASDPFFTWDVKPFVKTIKPGKYPVELLMSKIEEGHHRVAFAKLKVQKEKALTWEMAITEDIAQEEINNLKKGEIFGFGVDAGLGCFIDVETNLLYLEKIDEFYKISPDKNYYDDLLAGEFDEFSGKSPYSRPLGDWNIHHIDTTHDVVMFASGWGDGYYPCYWGMNAKNEIVELVIDFLVIGGE